MCSGPAKKRPSNETGKQSTGGSALPGKLEGSQAARPTLADQLKAAIEAYGRRMYALAKAADVADPVRNRFVHGWRNLTLRAVERLAAALELRRKVEVSENAAD